MEEFVKNKPKVTVLLSSFNGESFIEEQLNSIINQIDVQVSVLVRDDGSTDSTCEILNKWQEKRLIKWYTGENLGVANSFFDLLRNSSHSDYYAFADQDDIWMPEKLIVACSKLSEKGNNGGMYCSNLLCFDENGVIGLKRRKDEQTSKKTSLMRSVATGCTIVMDNRLRNLVLDHLPSKVLIHDLWVFHTALFLGYVILDPEAYIKYRQHRKNQIGAKITFKQRWNSRFRSLTNLRNQHEREYEAKLLLESYKNLLSKYDKLIINKVACYNSNIMNRLSLAFDFSYKKDFFTFLRILLGVL